MSVRLPFLRPLFATTIALVLTVDVSGCAREVDRPVIETPWEQPDVGSSTAREHAPDRSGSRVTRQDAAVFVDARVALEASRRTLPASANEHVRTVTLERLEERLANAKDAEVAMRRSVLVEISVDTRRDISRDEDLFDIHPVHARWRRAYTGVLVAVANALAAWDETSTGVLVEQSGSSALERRCPAASPPVVEEPTLPEDGSATSVPIDEASGGSASSTSPRGLGDATSPATATDDQRRGCDAFRAGEHERAADLWLGMLVARELPAFDGDDRLRADLHLLHVFARWFQYADRLDIEALVTARESLRIRILEDDHLYDGSARGARELAASVAAMDELDEVLLAARRETWDHFAMDAEKVVAKARRRASLDIGSGLAMIVTGSLILALPVPIFFFLSAFTGPFLAIVAGVWGTATAIAVGIGAKQLRQGRRARRLLAKETWSVDGPEHWFQPGVGRRLRDPSGLHPIDHGEAVRGEPATRPRSR